MDIPQLATILSSTFDPNLREEAEKKLNEVKIAKLMLHVRMCVMSLLNSSRYSQSLTVLVIFSVLIHIKFIYVSIDRISVQTFFLMASC